MSDEQQEAWAKKAMQK
jgi:hypothetical protein